MATVILRTGEHIQIPDWCAEDDEYLPSMSVENRLTTIKYRRIYPVLDVEEYYNEEADES